MTRQRKLIGQILKELRFIHEGHIQEALQVQREKGGPIGQILIEMKVISEGQLNRALGLQLGMEIVDLDQVEIAKDAVAEDRCVRERVPGRAVPARARARSPWPWPIR
ncbi:MAG: hypothetical protein U1E76_20675 [Planctomycetota bacterium]